jgi:hypothetical protein
MGTVAALAIAAASAMIVGELVTTEATGAEPAIGAMTAAALAGIAVEIGVTAVEIAWATAVPRQDRIRARAAATTPWAGPVRAAGVPLARAVRAAHRAWVAGHAAAAAVAVGDES